MLAYRGPDSQCRSEYARRSLSAVQAGQILKATKSSPSIQRTEPSSRGRIAPQRRDGVLRDKSVLTKSVIWLTALLSPFQALAALQCPCKTRDQSHATVEQEQLGIVPTCSSSCCHSRHGSSHGVEETQKAARRHESQGSGLTIKGQSACDCPPGCECEQHHCPAPAVPGSESQQADLSQSSDCPIVATVCSPEPRISLATLHLPATSSFPSAVERCAALCRFVV
jgi:hypothetical protein